MNKNWVSSSILDRAAAWLLIIAAAFCAFVLTQSIGAALLVAFISAALLTPRRDNEICFGLNDVDPALATNTLLDYTLRAFKRAMLPLSAFSTKFNDVQIRRGKNVEVPYYPLVTAASKDFDTCYVFDDDYTLGTREVPVNKRKYQEFTITGDDLARLPQLKVEEMGRMYGEKIAYDILEDILTVVTAANFGAAAFTGASTTFDSDDVTDLATVADIIPWPKTGRSLVVTPAYKGNLFKDGDVRLEYAYGDAGVIRDDMLPKVGGFGFDWSPAIPANGENLVGFISFPSAILVAFSPVAPPPMARKVMSQYEVVADPDTGIMLEYRAWGDPGCDADYHVIEANYGYAKGEADALRRLVSA
jgi:hypothetical protein